MQQPGQSSGGFPRCLHVLFLLSSLIPAVFAAPQHSDDLGWVPFDRKQFNGNASLDEKGHVQLFWKIGDDYSTFGIASKSSGYLSLGFSQTGAMTGADIAVGYTGEDGSFTFENRHATGFVYPEISEDQGNNMRLKEGHQNDGVTSFVFEKKNKADCLKIQADVAKDSWQWFIYAFSDDNIFTQHLPGHNGKQYVKLGSGKTIAVNELRQVPNTKNLTVTQPEVAIPTDETTYCYSMHKMPAGKKNYILAQEPAQANKLLHHLVLYACYGLSDEDKELVGKKPNCDWKNYSNPCNGFVTEWAPGVAGRTYEPGYGKPFGEDYYEYVMMETHYNNPEGLEGEKGAASYSFLYNDEPVDTEIGTLTLGDVQVDGWFLEPGKDLVPHSTVCTPECTERLPEDGVTAISVFHHMHNRGRIGRVQIIRDGKEITPLSTLRDFEYGYQFSKTLNSVKLLPGDKFITTCEYDTSNDTKPVPGGQPSTNEMCFAWVEYYPANKIIACTQKDLSKSQGSSLNGTVAMCVDQDKGQDLYKSDYLTSSYQHLQPETGKTCSASNVTGDSQPEPSGTNSPASEDDISHALSYFTSYSREYAVALAILSASLAAF